MQSIVRPRLAVAMPPLSVGVAGWRSRMRQIEDIGIDEVAISEHYSRGWSMEPLTALAYAAASTRRLRLLTMVLNNDVHNPAVLAKAIATVDVLSEGRVTLGIGAGWSPADYRALGVPFDPPSVRIERLGESIALLRAYFSGGVVDHHGIFYDAEGLEALPATVQQPGPRFSLGREARGCSNSLGVSRTWWEST